MMNAQLTFAMNILDKVRNTSSSTAKVTILHNALISPSGCALYNALIYTNHPLWQYYMTHTRAMALAGKTPVVDSRSLQPNIWEIFDGLASRNVSGHRAAQIWCSFVNSLPKELRAFVGRILDKKLGCGLSTTTINKAIPHDMELIPTFEVALGVSLQDLLKKRWEIDFAQRWFASRKFDGVRCLTFLYPDGRILTYSRQGKEFFTLDVLKASLRTPSVKRMIGQGLVLDGELSVNTNDPDDPDDFTGVMKVIRKKNFTIENICYHIFDALPMRIFLQRKGYAKLSLRTNDIRKIAAGCNPNVIKAVEQIPIANMGELHILEVAAIESGWEGLIVRRDGPYVGKRSKDILKDKNTKEMEAKVISVEMGEFDTVMNGRTVTLKGMSNAIILYKGNRVSIGGGWKRAQRLHYLKHPNELIGKIITVKYFEESKDRHGNFSLRFNRVKCVHGKERTT